VFHEASERARSTRENRRAPKRSREIPFLIVPITASGPQGVQPLVHRIMWVREVGKIDLKPREKGWLFGSGPFARCRCPASFGGRRGGGRTGEQSSDRLFLFWTSEGTGKHSALASRRWAGGRGRFPKRPNMDQQRTVFGQRESNCLIKTKHCDIRFESVNMKEQKKLKNYKNYERLKIQCEFCPVPSQLKCSKFKKARVNGRSNYDSFKVAKCLVI